MKEERGTGIDGDLAGWAGETSGRAAEVTGDSLLRVSGIVWVPGRVWFGGYV